LAVDRRRPRDSGPERRVRTNDVIAVTAVGAASWQSTVIG
jgi:hypothetical protein